MKDYVLEGNIDRASMIKENGIILRTLSDAQNNHDGLDIHAGDFISLRTVKELTDDESLLRFLENDVQYQDQECKVLAVVSRSLVEDTQLIGDEGLDVIMTGEQMHMNYRIDDYRMLMIDKQQENDTNVVIQLQKLLSGREDIGIADHSMAIRMKNEEVKRAELLLYGIAVLLVLISVFHIINTMFYMLESKRYSFAVLRTMGITEAAFYKMLFMQALKYAFSACVVIFGIYFGIIQRVTGYLLSHVYGYLNEPQGVPMGTLILVSGCVVVIFVVTVMANARRILGLDIVEELKIR